MSTLTYRSTKGTPLTNNEVDANFVALNTDKIEASGITFEALNANGDIGASSDQVPAGDHSHTNMALKDGSLQTNLNAQKVNGIEAATTATANKLLALNSTGALPADITGNAETATAADDSSLLGGQAAAYFLDRSNHTGANSPSLYEEFTTSGVWNKTTKTGLVAIKVTAIGGGGKGGNTSGAGHLGGGGGGGGGAASKYIAAASLADNETVTIGASEQNTTFGTHLTANKGANGANGGSGTVGAGGAGGTGATADYVLKGSRGAVGSTDLDIGSAHGGASAFGGYGQGGEGCIPSSTAGATGSAGDSGYLLVEEFY